MISDSLLVKHIFNLEQDSIRRNLLILCSVTICVWYLQTLWKNRKLYFLSWNVPGPLALPIIGNAYIFLTAPVSDALKVVHDLTKKYPKIVKIWFGSKLLYAVHDPVYIGKILNSPNATAKDDIFYSTVKDIFRESLITAKVHTWRKNRKLISPSFNQKILDSFVEIFAEQSEVFVEHLKKHVGQKNLDIYLLTTRCTLDIICQTAMGVDMHVQTTNGNLGVILEKVLELSAIRAIKIWYHFDIIWNLSSLGKEFKQALDELFSVTGSVVRKKMAEHDRKNNCDFIMAEIEEEPVVKRLAFLDLVLENSDFTEDELNSEVDLFLLAGTETTASALTFVFTVLGVLQDVQQRIYEEVMDAIGPDEVVQPIHLRKLHYTERVIKETLRMFPIAFFFSRHVTEDLDLGNLVIPKGANVGFPISRIHSNEAYWPDPSKFDPDRFLPENSAKRHPFAYLPFSAGPRNCIGWRYAMMSMKTLLVAVIKNFRIFSEYKSLEEIELKITILLRMKHGPKLWLESR